MFENVLIILVCYVVGVSMYTLITRNDAMHKHDPHVNIRSIIKDGAIGMAIGFAAVAVIFYGWIFVKNLLI